MPFSLTERIRAPFIKDLGGVLTKKLGLANGLSIRGLNVAGSEVIDLIGTDTNNKLRVGGAYARGNLTPLSISILTTAKITGAPAAAGLDTLTQFLATQVDCAGTPQVCTARYEHAADLVKKHLIKLLEEIAPKFPSAQTKADVDEIDAKIAALAAKRRALFDAARSEK